MIRPPALLLGVPIADLGEAETLGLIGDMVRDGRATGATHQIATANVDFLVNALADERLRRILQSADLCLADGMGVKWGAAVVGMPIRERVAGADLFPLLVDASQHNGWRVHVFGSKPSTVRSAEALVRERLPRSSVTFDAGPQISDPTDVPEAVLDAIAAVDADILCVALGNPKQELFIDANRERLGAPVMIGIGGSLDFFTGDRRRAPGWMQRTGTEWIARMVQEPARLAPRYARDLWVYTPRLAREWRVTQARRREAGITVELEPAAVVARFDGRAAAPGPVEWQRAIDRISVGAELRVSPGSATAVADPALACLVGLLQHARRQNAKVVWLDDPARLAPLVRPFGISVEFFTSP